MDRAPLRPVPGRPSGPVPDAAAVHQVASVLPAVAERERAALGLVVLSGRSRAEVARRLGLDAAQLARALAHARKELRRAVRALPGSGWCERAELLISDRLDGALSEHWEPRLDVHLRNCPRCVEHERRLVQATDALVAGVPPVPWSPELAPVEEGEPAEPEEAAQPGAIEPQPTPLPDATDARLLRQKRAVALARYLLIVVAILLVMAAVAIAVAAALGAG